MASAVHDYQYSVQVNSRFDAFMSDDLNSEDPDLYLRKVQSRRKEEMPKDKSKARVDHADGPERVDVAAEDARKSQAKSGQSEKKGGSSPQNFGDEFDVLEPNLNASDPAAPRRGSAQRGKAVKMPNQRQFDRRSGSDKTGVKAVMKKDGHGTGNWGTFEDELDVTMPADGKTALQSLDPQDPLSNEELVSEGTKDHPEEEIKTLTVYEYRQQARKKHTVQLSTKGSRQANDGKDVFTNMVAVHKPKPVEKVPDVLADLEVTEETDKPTFFEFKPLQRGRGRGSGNPEQRGRGAGNFEQRGRGVGNFEQRGRGASNFEQRGRAGSFEHRGRGAGSFEHRGGGTDNFEHRGHGASTFEHRARGGGNFEHRGRGAEFEHRGRGAEFEHRGRGAGQVERGGGHQEGPSAPLRGRASGDFERSRGGRGRGRPFEGGDRSMGERGRGRGVANAEHGRGRGSANVEYSATFAGRGGERSGFRGGSGGRGRGGQGRGFAARGFRGGRTSFANNDYETSVPVVPQAPAMDSDIDFPSLK